MTSYEGTYQRYSMPRPEYLATIAPLAKRPSSQLDKPVEELKPGLRPYALVRKFLDSDDAPLAVRRNAAEQALSAVAEAQSSGELEPPLTPDIARIVDGIIERREAGGYIFFDNGERLTTVFNKIDVYSLGSEQV